MKIDNYEPFKIAIIGLGYVGLPLAVEFAKKYPVIGFDINKERVQELSRGVDRTKEANIEELSSVISTADGGTENGLTFSSDIKDLHAYNTFIVTVPTPINKFKSPDLTPLLKASEMV